MAVIRITTNMILKQVFLNHRLIPPLSVTRTLSNLHWASIEVPNRQISFCRIKCAASDNKKVSARLSQVHQLLQEAEERASAVGNEPTPKITRGHVTVSFARSGGPGGQNVNKVNTKVDMRFNVKKAYWLSDRIRERIMQMAIIDAASYVPPPPSEEQKKKIAKLASIGEQKRLRSKKALSDKKAFRRSRDSWD